MPRTDHEPLTAGHLALMANRVLPTELRIACVATMAHAAYFGTMPSGTIRILREATPDAERGSIRVLLDTLDRVQRATDRAIRPLHRTILNAFRIPLLDQRNCNRITAALQTAAHHCLSPRNAVPPNLPEFPAIPNIPDEQLFGSVPPMSAMVNAQLQNLLIQGNSPQSSSDALAAHPPPFHHPSISVPYPVSTCSLLALSETLALTARFAGLLGPWSVAHHSILAARLAPPSARLHTLLHDAHEVFTGDLPTPSRNLIAIHEPRIAEDITRCKHALDVLIRQQLAVPEPGPATLDAVHTADDAALSGEFACFFTNIDTSHRAATIRNARHANPPLPGIPDRDIFINDHDLWLTLADRSRAEAAQLFRQLFHALC